VRRAIRKPLSITGSVRRGVAALAILAALTLPGCEKLNPQWCASARCGGGEYCDPQTNSCRPREGGVTDGTLDRSLRDTPQTEHRLIDSSPKDAPNPCAMTVKGWTCSGGAAGTCGDAGFFKQRACPLGQCAYGHCQRPATVTLCTSTKACTGLWICTLLLDSAGAAANMCAAPVGGSPTPSSCSSGLDCQSGLCTSAGRCYTACDDVTDCPSTPSHICAASVLLVEGVVVTAKTCTPQ
jgi:hypothetical protein